MYTVVGPIVCMHQVDDSLRASFISSSSVNGSKKIAK